MIRRMADKLTNKPSSPTNKSAMAAPDQPVHHSPSSSLASTQSSLLSSGHRQSISTQATSATSEPSSKSQTAMEVDTVPATVVVPSQVVTPAVQPQPRRQTGSYRLSDFIIHRTLGTGSFGRVHLGAFAHTTRVSSLIALVVRSKHNLRFYAIKVLNKEKIVRMKQVSHTRNEQAMLQAVTHSFIINLWGTFQDCTNLYMVMDFVPGGELFTLLRRSNVSASFDRRRVRFGIS